MIIIDIVEDGSNGLGLDWLSPHKSDNLPLIPLGGMDGGGCFGTCKDESRGDSV